MRPDHPRRAVHDLMTRYLGMTTDELSDEGRRLAERPPTCQDAEIPIFLGVVVGRLAALEDRLARVRRLMAERKAGLN